MRSMSFYDRVSELNDFMYKEARDFGSWKLLDTYSDNTGLYIRLYDIGNNEFLFVIRGTDILSVSLEDIKADLKADAILVINKIPGQFNKACQYYESIKDKYPNIIFTGYSLGGSIVQMLNDKYGNESISYEGYGTGLGNSNLVNFGNVCDPVFMINLAKQKGKIYLMGVNIKDYKEMRFFVHLPGNYGKPRNSVSLQRISNETINKYKILCDSFVNKSKNISNYLRSGVLDTKEKLINSLSK